MLSSCVYYAANSCRCHLFWGMDEHSSRRLSKIPHSPCSRPWCLHPSHIFNWIYGRPEEHLSIAMGSLVVSGDVGLDPVGNSGIHSVGCVFTALRPDSLSCACRFIITNNGSGHTVAGLRYKEYQLGDYSSWFLKKLNNTRNWKDLKSCLVKSDDCNNLPKRYKTLKQYKMAKLTPIEAGCCRPPSECGYPTVNATYYDLSFHPTSSNNDCKLYKNSRVIKCYNCDSCKAGVAQYMKIEWRVVAIFNVVLFVVLSMVYFVGCCARRNAARNRSPKV
ncbi:hypothetical protein HHK36_027763 [Tetracentron sinense]|uniref:Tetraspanin-10 n=1 Tax=Tetracentron sinense TaxID=13715 RepID=A0A834YIM4_TETSI|nr:hypothetical protein HHK36_027763 [Tetracentron sinense]